MRLRRQKVATDMLRKFSVPRVRQDAKIRGDRLTQGIFIDISILKVFSPKTQFPNHAFLRFGTEHSMMRKMHIAKEINTLMPLPE